MKMITPICFLVLATAGWGQTPMMNQASAPQYTLHVESEAEQLARGYATAFTGITHTPIYLNVRWAGATVTLVSVRSLKAVAGVLVVETDKGLTYVLNPKDVVSLTDAPPRKES